MLKFWDNIFKTTISNSIEGRFVIYIMDCNLLASKVGRRVLGENSVSGHDIGKPNNRGMRVRHQAHDIMHVQYPAHRSYMCARFACDQGYVFAPTALCRLSALVSHLPTTHQCIPAPQLPTLKCHPMPKGFFWSFLSNILIFLGLKGIK